MAELGDEFICDNYPNEVLTVTEAFGGSGIFRTTRNGGNTNICSDRNRIEPHLCMVHIPGDNTLLRKITKKEEEIVW